MSMNIHELPKMNRCKGDLRRRERGRGLKNDMECERGIWAACGGMAGPSKVSKASKTNTQPRGGGRGVNPAAGHLQHWHSAGLS